jgi:N-acetylglucosaminyl-diphospho-decaprenol L-rhamnosyltransferase
MADSRPTDNPTHAALTVILVNYRSLANIETAFAAGGLSGHNVIVVDNGDDPAGVTRVCAEHHATPLLLDHNIGFAAAVNRAVATIADPTRPWLLLNPDVRVTSAQLKELAEALRDGPDGIAPLLAGSDGRLQIGSGGGALSLSSVAIYFLFVAHLFPRLRGVFLTRSQSRQARRVAWLCMACLLLTPDAFTRFGPIPEDELVYAEDVAWGTAASERGARFELVPGLVVRHDQGASGASRRWSGAFERLCRARLGPVRGRFAVIAVRAGVGTRRLLGRQVA